MKFLQAMPVALAGLACWNPRADVLGISLQLRLRKRKTKELAM